METKSEVITTRGAMARRTAADTTATVTRALLACGAVTGPLFSGMVAIQMLVRPGFDIRRHPISLLTLGDLGWIQMGTFVLTGLGGVACAVGVRRALRPGRGSTWGSLLVGLWGLSLIAAGVFRPDPSLGFPPGAPQGTPDHLSWPAVMHGVAFFTSFVSLVVACFVFARRFAGLRRLDWAAYCVATGVAAPAIVALAMANPTAAGIPYGMPYALAGAVAFGWVSVLALRLVAELGSRT